MRPSTTKKIAAAIRNTRSYRFLMSWPCAVAALGGYKLSITEQPVTAAATPASASTRARRVGVVRNIGKGVSEVDRSAVAVSARDETRPAESATWPDLGRTAPIIPADFGHVSGAGRPPEGADRHSGHNAAHGAEEDGEGPHGWLRRVRIEPDRLVGCRGAPRTDLVGRCQSRPRSRGPDCPRTQVSAGALGLVVRPDHSGAALASRARLDLGGSAGRPVPPGEPCPVRTNGRLPGGPSSHRGGPPIADRAVRRHPLRRAHGPARDADPVRPATDRARRAGDAAPASCPAGPPAAPHPAGPPLAGLPRREPPGGGMGPVRGHDVGYPFLANLRAGPAGRPRSRSRTRRLPRDGDALLVARGWPRSEPMADSAPVAGAVCLPADAPEHVPGTRDLQRLRAALSDLRQHAARLGAQPPGGPAAGGRADVGHRRRR